MCHVSGLMAHLTPGSTLHDCKTVLQMHTCECHVGAGEVVRHKMRKVIAREAAGGARRRDQRPPQAAAVRHAVQAL